MAVVQYSALVTQLRGKLGGSQFNRGHSVQTLQRKSTPTVRQTPAQIAQRQRVGVAQRAWKAETDQRRNEASQAAVSNPVYNRLGQQVTLTGYNHYVKMMSWRTLTNSGTNPMNPANPIVTTPAEYFMAEVSNFTLSFFDYQPPGRYSFTVSFDRTMNGTISVPAGQYRTYYYVTPIFPNGRPKRGARRMFLFWGSAVAGTGLSVTQSLHTSMVFNTGDFLLLEVFTRDVSAGAETGYFSEIIQLQ